ncbi:MAG: hypothetical protein ACKOA8_04260, partial [Deltaproteobacteria bacterium]
MKLLTRVSLALISMSFSIPFCASFAVDLSDSSMVMKQTQSVDLYEVTGVEIKKQDYSKTEIDTAVSENLKAIVWVKLAVEGNICLNSPESLAVQFESVAGTRDQNVRLTTSGPYEADPWGPISACTSHSKQSEVVVP